MLTNITYWEENSNDEKDVDHSNNGVAYFLNTHLAKQEINARAFEFGFYPGNFIRFVHDKGYQINGIDFHPRSPQLKEKLQNRAFDIGDLFFHDISTFDSTDKRYDLVYSVGFIEHFINWQQILELHASLVTHGGKLIITAPNFRSLFPRIYHFIWNRESFKIHYLPSMKPHSWAAILVKHGFKIEYAGHFGGTHFWSESKNGNKFFVYSSRLYVALVLFIKQVIPVKFRADNQFNCFCGIVATRM
jgi:2-polyprenyl-3-methyl-5-hydroxy-6-metoxy-1,4-benzoquinol methylase